MKWWQHIPNKELYGDLPAVTDKIASKRTTLAGHCTRHSELPASKVILWEPTHGHRRRGRPRGTYMDTLMRDAGLTSIAELRTCMMERDDWRIRTRVRLRPT